MNRKKYKRFILTFLGLTSVFFIFMFLRIDSRQKKVHDTHLILRDNGWTALDKTVVQNKTKQTPVETMVQEPETLNSNISNNYGTCHFGKKVRLFQKPTHFEYFTSNYFLEKEPAKSQLSEKSAKHFCADRIVSYDNKLFILHDVFMFPKERSDNGVQGGEGIIKVLNQKESKELFQYKNGFLKLPCSKDSNRPDPKRHGNKWLQSIKYEESKMEGNKTETVDRYIIAIERGDYANLHNWARGIFNVFLAMVKFNIQPDEMSVLFLDAHPFSALDLAWEQIFGPILRIGHMKNPILCRNLIFTFPEPDGPVSDFRQKYIGETEEYRDFVLSRHGLKSEPLKLSCPRIKITIIIRRNAVYHPRNTEGRVGRKIFNEAELIAKITEVFPDACVQAIMMETLPFNLQLEIISQTDVLIGMHGAGMSHTLFLPQHAAVLELFSKGLKIGRPWFVCFQSIARWRNLKYDTWENFDPSIEMPHDYTILPVDTIVKKLRGLVNELCKS